MADKEKKQEISKNAGEIKSLRQKIDKIDEEIVNLLNERAELAIEAGRLKHGDAKPFYTPERERQIFEKLTSLSRGPMQKRQLLAVFREIISAARNLEKPLLVGYWGPAGTFTHMAALKQFGSSTEFCALDSIEDVFRNVEHGEADYGVAPVENSVAGVVPETLDMFPQTNVKICSEVYVEIAHHLLSVCSSLDDVERVYAGPQPLHQCRKWLKANLPKAEIIESIPTARAAERALDDKGGAAIGNLLTSDTVGIPVLVEHIEDNPHNRTRFLVIGYNEPAPTGRDKTSLMFNLRNRPGELYRALGAFDRHNVNLMMIESRPAQRATFEYIFYVDCQGHHTDEHLVKAIDTLKSYALECVLLGSYPEAHDAVPHN